MKVLVTAAGVFIGVTPVLRLLGCGNAVMGESGR